MNIEKILQTTSMPKERKAVVSLLYTAYVVNEKLNEILKPFDVSLPQFNVLRILRGQKGSPLNLSDIQNRMIHKMSNTSRLVDKLVAKKLVNRIICENNRRKVEISITEEGLLLLEKLDPLITSVEISVTKDVSNDTLETFNDTLEKIRN